MRQGTGDRRPPAPDLALSPSARPLPPGFRVALDPGTRRLDGGRAVLGGSPLRVLRLSDAGAALVDALGGGQPVPLSPAAQRLARRLLDAGLAHPRPAGGSVTPDQVALVVPVRDRPQGAARAVGGAGPVGEVVVVDDGSRVPVAGAPGITVVRHDRPLGPAAARNRGWRATTAPVVAFLDSDCEPSPGWLAPLLAHLDDPAVVAVAPRVRPRAGQGVLARYEAARSPLDLGPAESAVRPGTPVSYVPAATLVVRRRALEGLGGFDEDLRFGEDVDLVWRLADAGGAVRYEPRSVVTHDVRPGLVPWLRQRAGYGSAAAPLAARHPGALPPLRMSPWSLVAWGLVLGGRPLAGAAVAGVSAAVLARRLGDLPHRWRAAIRITARGHAAAGRQLGDAARRAWWPLALAAASLSRRPRRVVLALTVVPPALEWVARRPPLDPLRGLALRLADDLAYGTGVWVGCWRAGTADPLVPDLGAGRAWPRSAT